MGFWRPTSGIHPNGSFERLRDEYGVTGRITIVKDYVAGSRRPTLEIFGLDAPLWWATERLSAAILFIQLAKFARKLYIFVAL